MRPSTQPKTALTRFQLLRSLRRFARLQPLRGATGKRVGALGGQIIRSGNIPENGTQQGRDGKPQLHIPRGDVQYPGKGPTGGDGPKYPVTAFEPDASIKSLENEQALKDYINTKKYVGYNGLDPDPSWNWEKGPDGFYK